VLFDSSEEAPQLRGLQFCPGTVCRVAIERETSHMGWNQVAATCTSRLLEGIDNKRLLLLAHPTRCRFEWSVGRKLVRTERHRRGRGKTKYLRRAIPSERAATGGGLCGIF